MGNELLDALIILIFGMLAVTFGALTVYTLRHSPEEWERNRKRRLKEKRKTKSLLDLFYKGKK